MIRPLVAHFIWPVQKTQTRYTLDIYPEQVSDLVVHAVFEAPPHVAKSQRHPIAFRRSDGQQLVTNRDGKTALGGWRLDLRQLAHTADLDRGLT